VDGDGRVILIADAVWSPAPPLNRGYPVSVTRQLAEVGERSDAGWGENFNAEWQRRSPHPDRLAFAPTVDLPPPGEGRNARHIRHVFSASDADRCAYFRLLEHVQFHRKLNVLWIPAFIAFSNGKPNSSLDQVRGRLFLKML
jgi:hypothetical protein